MTDSRPLHTLSHNCLSIKRAYLLEVILPALQDVGEKNTPIEKCYHIGGRNLCIQFYSPALSESLTPALAHSEIQRPSKIDLTVHVWDSVSSHTPFASPLNNGEYSFDVATETRTVIDDDFMGVYTNAEETLTLYDRANKTAYFWIHDASAVPVWVCAAPFRTLLQWYLDEFNIHLLHGAVIGNNGKSALLTAKGGSGKSTTALAGLFSGMSYLGDDYVGIQASDKVIAHTLYSSAKVSPQYVQAFSRLKGHVWSQEGEKSVVFLASLFPSQIPSTCPLSAIVIPVIKHRERSVIIDASKTQAMMAIMPTTLLQLPLFSTNKIKILKKIIEQTPCYSIELSSDSAEAASTINDLLETL